MERPAIRAVALHALLQSGWLLPDTPTPFLFHSDASPKRPQITTLHPFLTTQSLPLWWDQDIPAGAEWRAQIKDRLQSASTVVTFWTADSVRSNPVIEEAATAQQGHRLIHVRLDDAALPYGFAETQHIDLHAWDGTATHPQMAKLLHALHDRLSPPAGNGALGWQTFPRHTPPHIRPEVENKPDLGHALTAVHMALHAETLSW